MAEITSSVKLRILELLTASPAGATDREMQTVLSLDPNIQRPRRVELAKAGIIQVSHLRRRTAFEELPDQVWEIRPDDAPRAARPPSKKRALEPFLAKAAALLEAQPQLKERDTVAITITVRDLRRLVRAFT